MQNIRRYVPRVRRVRERIGAGCLLLLYLATATPIVPVAVSLFAGLDQSHHVGIQKTRQGLEVVLRHALLGSPSHRHGMVARAFTFFARPTATPQSDHVIQFGVVDAAQTTPDPGELASKPQELEGLIAWDLHSQAPVAPVDLAALSRPPPAVSGLIPAVRSTVLRI